MKKLAIAALSLGLLGAVSAAHAAPVTIDAGNFELTYQDEFLTGLSLTYADGVFSLTGPGLVANATGGVDAEPSFGILSVNSYTGLFPILLAPKAGYQISGVTESVLGSYSASAGSSEGASAMVSAGLVSRWVYLNGADMLGQNIAGTVAAALAAGDAPVQGSFIATGAVDFMPQMASLNLAPGTVGLSSLDVLVGAGAQGNGSAAAGTLTTYRLGVAVTAVPEPEALGLLLAGLGVVGVALGRRRPR